MVEVSYIKLSSTLLRTRTYAWAMSGLAEKAPTGTVTFLFSDVVG
jgi:hypothetical protein